MASENDEKKKGKPVKPITVRVEDFKRELNRVVAESKLQPFLLEMILGGMLSGISSVSKREYAQSREEWEKACGEWKKTCEEGEKDG